MLFSTTATTFCQTCYVGLYNLIDMRGGPRLLHGRGLRIHAKIAILNFTISQSQAMLAARHNTNEQKRTTKNPGKTTEHNNRPSSRQNKQTTENTTEQTTKHNETKKKGVHTSSSSSSSSSCSIAMWSSVASSGSSCAVSLLSFLPRADSAPPTFFPADPPFFFLSSSISFCRSLKRRSKGNASAERGSFAHICRAVVRPYSKLCASILTT